LGPLAIVNHPYCLSCLLRFEECVGPARIGEMGLCEGIGWVRIRDATFFSHAGIVGSDGGPRPQRVQSTGLGVYSPFRMNNASLDLVRLIKFSRRRSLAPLASAAMAYALAAWARVDREAVLVPVPMHRSARRRRGFNQAEVLARGVGEAVGLPVWEALIKPARTCPQSQTGHRLRADNVRGAYRPAGIPLGGRCVYLVDDLVTTGATAAACAATLLAAGAGEVAVLCLARMP
jgi:ComF family protein